MERVSNKKTNCVGLAHVAQHASQSVKSSTSRRLSAWTGPPTAGWRVARARREAVNKEHTCDNRRHGQHTITPICTEEPSRVRRSASTCRVIMPRLIDSTCPPRAGALCSEIKSSADVMSHAQTDLLAGNEIRCSKSAQCVRPSHCRGEPRSPRCIQLTVTVFKITAEMKQEKYCIWKICFTVPQYLNGRALSEEITPERDLTRRWGNRPPPASGRHWPAYMTTPRSCSSCSS